MKHLNLRYIWCVEGLLLVFLCVSCSKVEEIIPSNNQEQGFDKHNLTAVISDGLRNNWNVGDNILLLHDGQTVIVTADECSNISNLSGFIDGTFTDESPLLGIYPAENLISSDSKSVTVAIPTIQIGGEGGADEASEVIVARTLSDTLFFQSVCGGITFNFQMSGVTKVEIESVDGYPLSGIAKLKWDKQGKPIADEISNASNIITLNAKDESGFIPGKSYSISTLPCDVYGGYRLSMYRDGLVAHYFDVHQTIERAIYISPTDMVEDELEFDNPNTPLVEEERPVLDATTRSLLRQYQMNPTEKNKLALLYQMGIRYDKVVARKKAKLRELEREAKTQNLIDEMQAIVDEMVDNREIRLEQQFLRLIDPRVDDDPNDAWVVLRGASALNAYIGFAPVTNFEYALFMDDYIYDYGKENYPLVNISIDEAMAYCDWLTAHDNLHIYRLPSDEEWTLGAGHMPKDVAMNAGRVESGLTAVDTYSQTTGACGGIDFWGNCWEWTSSTDANGLYIIKGGSWDSNRDDCRSEKSDVVRKGSQRYSNVGFRIVRTDLSNACGL